MRADTTLLRLAGALSGILDKRLGEGEASPVPLYTPLPVRFMTDRDYGWLCENQPALDTRT
jgi:hypothetical protein